MRILKRRLPIRAVVLAGALLSILTLGAPARAATQITQPAANAQNCGGMLLIDVTTTSSNWMEVQIEITAPGGAMMEAGVATKVSETRWFFECASWMHLDGPCSVKATARKPVFGGGWVTDASPPVSITTLNPCSTRKLASAKLKCPCKRDCVPTGSSTSPLTGHQAFSVPITSWQHHGATFDFDLSYSSHGMADPQSRLVAADFQSQDTAQLDGLSGRPSRWSHPYAQWIDLYQDEAGKLYAVWHHDGTLLAFEWNPATGQFLSPESNVSLRWGGPAVTSPPFQAGIDGETTLTTPIAGSSCGTRAARSMSSITRFRAGRITSTGASGAAASPRRSRTTCSRASGSE